MNAYLLKLIRQPATVNGVDIVSRKLYIYKALATINGVDSPPTFIEGAEEYLQDVTWEAITSADVSDNANVRTLQLIAMMNGFTEPDQLVAHLAAPPRIYPVY